MEQLLHTQIPVERFLSSTIALQMPEAAKKLKGVLKQFFILIQHFQADFDKIMEEDWLAEQPNPGCGVSSLER